MKKNLFLLLVLLLAFFLRFYKLGENPPSLYWDEASLGYNSYSIATSLKDEHGEFLPLARFISFGDYKPPGYIYAASVQVKLFGLNEFTVRFPSFLGGFLIVILTYFLSKELFKSEKISLLAALIISVSPWAIHFSRAAFEANLAAFFNLMGVYLFIKAIKKRWLLLFSIIAFILSFFTFNANRIIAPLLFGTIFLIYFREMIDHKKWIVLSILTALIMLIPSIPFLKSSDSKLRFQEVSIFNNLEPVRMSNTLIEDDGSNLLSKINHNRRIIFAADFLKHYTDNFSLRFLFTHGDVNPRLAIQEMGQLYLFELPFLIIGIYFLIRRKDKTTLLIFSWMLIAPIPAGMARETPHALRIISILPTFQIIIAYGIYQLVPVVRGLLRPRQLAGPRNDILHFFLVLIVSLNIFYYLHNYHKHFPYDWSGEWQYGYKEMVNYVLENENKYDKILVTNALGRPYIYFAFYKPYGNEEFLNEAKATRDQFGFYDVKSLGKIRFEWENTSQIPGRLLLVRTDNHISEGFKWVKTIKNLKEENVFYIFERT